MSQLRADLIRTASPVGRLLRRGATAGIAAVALLAGAGAAGANAASVFYIVGAGNGHGVGMSQYGAYGYALHGADYRSILAHYYQGTSLGSVDPNQIVRVLLEDSQSSSFSDATQASGIELALPQKRAKAARHASPTPAPHEGSVSLNAGVTYSARIAAGGALVLSDQSGRVVARFGSPVTISSAVPIDVAGLGAYRGALELQGDGGGGVETIDAVQLEDYVCGVVAAEMPASWSLAALEAQAVAARTYAITADVGGDGYTLYADTRSQEYGGVAAETPSSDEAVAATTGQVVTYRGVPVITYFFSSSGGYTEDNQNVWPGSTPEPWLQGVPDPYDDAGGDPYHHWQFELALGSATAKLGALVKGALVGVRVIQHGVSPRIITAQIVGTRGRVTVSGEQLEQLFGLQSTYAAFTTITTGAISTTVTMPAHSARELPGVPSRIVAAIVRLVRVPVGLPTLGVRGRVFPAPGRGARVTVEAVQRGGGWRTVGSAPLTGGRYALVVPSPGTYRVLYAGLSGPAVSVS